MAKRDDSGIALELRLKAIESRNAPSDSKFSQSQIKSQPSDINHTTPDYINNYSLQIPPEEVSKAPILHLEVQESASLTTGCAFSINAQGLIGSIRKANDGIVYIGLKSKDVLQIIRDYQLIMTLKYLVQKLEWERSMRKYTME